MGYIQDVLNTTRPDQDRYLVIDFCLVLFLTYIPRGSGVMRLCRYVLTNIGYGLERKSWSWNCEK